MEDGGELQKGIPSTCNFDIEKILRSRWSHFPLGNISAGYHSHAGLDNARSVAVVMLV
jgi:hypothetical protein